VGWGKGNFFDQRSDQPEKNITNKNVGCFWGFKLTLFPLPSMIHVPAIGFLS
jgi:hypothetical protein